MALAESIYELLKDDSNVSGVVGDRVYKAPAPQDATYPRLTFQQIGLEREYYVGGYGNRQQARFQIDSWGEPTTKGQSDVLTLAGHVITAMEAAGNTNMGTTNATSVDAVFLENELDLPEDPRDGSQFGIQRISQEWLISLQ